MESVRFPDGFKMSANVIEVASAVLIRDGRILLTQRLPRSDFPFCWESPGGKIKDDESIYQAISREVNEEIGVHILNVKKIIQQIDFIGTHQTTQHGKETIDRVKYNTRIYFCRVEWEGEPKSLEGQGIGWFTEAEMFKLTLAPANELAKALFFI